MKPAIRLLRPYIRRHSPALAGASLATVVLAAAQLASPWPLKLVIDRLLDGRSAPFELGRGELAFLAAVALGVVAIALVEAVANYCSYLWLNRAAERIVHDLRVATYAHLQRLSLAFHRRRAKGDLVTHVTGDVTAVGQLFSQTLGTLASSALFLVGMAAITFLLDPVLALAVFALVPALALLSRRSQRKVRRLARQQRAADGEIASLATEALSAMPVVKAFGAETYESERVGVWSDARRRTAEQASRAEASFSGYVDVVGALGVAAVIVLGVFRVAAGELQPGDLIVFSAYARRTYRPLRDISKEATRAARAVARAERLAEVLAADQLLEDVPNAPGGARAKGQIELDDVVFAYEPDRPVLEKLSLRIPAGSRLAVVGHSGAGKSTVCALVARFADPTRGRILIDGQDARSTSLSWLREQVGILLQDTLLFSGTVAENISYGTAARSQEVMAVARAAGAHDFIRRLPNGYDTDLGPGGAALSGGERQRIGIARVLLRDPPILLLDEPTTGLDVKSEARVLDGIANLMRGRTTIIVTHSLALACSADRVVVLERGSLVEDGSPEELMQRLGPFRSMVTEHSPTNRAALAWR